VNPAAEQAAMPEQHARRAKESTYPELFQTRRCKLVVLAIEVVGRWSQEAATFLRLLAQAKARTIPARPVVCPNHPYSYDRLCGQSPGI